MIEMLVSLDLATGQVTLMPSGEESALRALRRHRGRLATALLDALADYQTEEV